MVIEGVGNGCGIRAKSIPMKEGLDSGRTLFKVFHRVAGEAFLEIRR